MSWALRFESVTKRYRAGLPRYRSVRDDLTGALRRRPRVAGAEVVALRELCFAVDAGEAVALIGPNGAGKSTALRIAARITAPTSGTVRVRGRVGALIDVGAGIHPELTGRENIWLYGAICGLDRHAVAARFDAIVALAELEHDLDRQVKHYSSGMQLRLGFSIAASVEPEVLVVDEALAVGDARFQARCLARMSELTSSGTSLLYVSHDLASVQAVCERAVLLVGGTIAHDGPATETVKAYIHWIEQEAASTHPDVAAVLLDRGGQAASTFVPLGQLRVRCTVAAAPVDRQLGLVVRDGNPWTTFGVRANLPAGTTALECVIERLPLAGGVYQLWAAIGEDVSSGAQWQPIGSFHVLDDDEQGAGDAAGAGGRPPWMQPIAVDARWTVIDRL